VVTSRAARYCTGKAAQAARERLLTGDIIQVVADRKHVSFMYSYPNYVPLSAAAVERIVWAVEPFQYERVYGCVLGHGDRAGREGALLPDLRSGIGGRSAARERE